MADFKTHNLKIGALAALAFGFSVNLSAPVMAQDAEPSVEQALAQCIHEKDPELLIAIRDAASEQEFVEAFERGVELCEYPEQEYSMGRFFNAIAELAGPPEYDE